MKLDTALGALWAVALGTLSFNCGDDDGNGGDGGGNAADGGSCAGYNGTTECLDYTGTEWDSSTASIHCQGMQGVYASGGCDLAGAVGRCTITGGDPLEYYHVYYDQAAEAENACALNNGIWEPL